MRLAITGAAGYLGQALARRAAAAGAEVLGLDLRPPPPAWPPGAAFLRRDVTAPGLAAALRPFRPTALAHLAWVFDPTHRAAQERAVDLGGTVRVFRAAAALGVERLVYPSSTTAYGIQPNRTAPYREEDPPRPNPAYPYAAHKARVEQWLPGYRAAHPEVGLVVLRACIVVGPRARNIVTRILELPLIPRVSGYDPPLQLLHEEDAAECLWHGLVAAPPGTYNVAGTGVIRYSEVCRAAGRVAVAAPAGILYPLVAAAWRLRLFPFPPGLLDYIRYPWVADVSRLGERFGWRPRWSSREALAAYLAAAGRSR